MRIGSLVCMLFVAALSASGALAATGTSQNKLIKFSDKGIEPQTLEMSTDDSIVFFYNESQESLATLEVDFRGKTTHCAGTNLKAAEDGFIRSIKPFGPKDFATTCFHAPGEYSYTAYGLKSSPAGIKGKIIVK